MLEDTLVETQQAIEMADIYGSILNSMTHAFASIISNNQNTIMKTLALVTIVLSIPTMVFSAYGMNFKDNIIPFNDIPYAFGGLSSSHLQSAYHLPSTSSVRDGFNLRRLTCHLQKSTD